MAWILDFGRLCRVSLCAAPIGLDFAFLLSDFGFAILAQFQPLHKKTTTGQTNLGQQIFDMLPKQIDPMTFILRDTCTSPTCDGC